MQIAVQDQHEDAATRGPKNVKQEHVAKFGRLSGTSVCTSNTVFQT